VGVEINEQFQWSENKVTIGQYNHSRSKIKREKNRAGEDAELNVKIRRKNIKKENNQHLK
jgi:hypothetical protein